MKIAPIVVLFGQPGLKAFLQIEVAIRSQRRATCASLEPIRCAAGLDRRHKLCTPFKNSVPLFTKAQPTQDDRDRDKRENALASLHESSHVPGGF
jgi:hypothetical protein